MWEEVVGTALRWRHNGHDGVSNHQPHDCLLKRSGADHRKHQLSLAFVWGIHRGLVNFLHKWPVTRKMFPFDDIIMCLLGRRYWFLHRIQVCCKASQQLLENPCGILSGFSPHGLLAVLEIRTSPQSKVDSFGGGLETYCWFFFNFMFMIWDSRHEDFFWLSFTDCLLKAIDTVKLLTSILTHHWPSYPNITERCCYLTSLCFYSLLCNIL